MQSLTLALTLLASTAHAAPMDGLPDPRVVDGICGSRFGGELASVVVHRADGEVRALELWPDLSTVSHPPTTIYGPDGRERLVIPEYPVVPGSPEALAIAKARAAAVDGGKPAETLTCRVTRRSIHELEGAKPGRYLVEAWVAHVYRCPPCPTHAVCKPCHRHHAILSESKRSDAGLWPLGKSEIIGFTGKLAPNVGAHYRLRVAVTGLRGISAHTIPDVEILAMEPLPN